MTVSHSLPHSPVGLNQTCENNHSAKDSKDNRFKRQEMVTVTRDEYKYNLLHLLNEITLSLKLNETKIIG